MNKSIVHSSGGIYNHMVTYYYTTLDKWCLLLLQDYERALRQLSLDDIERLAGRLLHPDSDGMETSYMD